MSEQPEPGSDRVTVSMPRGYKARLEAAVAAGSAPSVSALVTAAVEDRLARELTLARLMERRGGRPLDPDAVAYWHKQFGAEDEVTGQVST